VAQVDALLEDHQPVDLHHLPTAWDHARHAVHRGLAKRLLGQWPHLFGQVEDVHGIGVVCFIVMKATHKGAGFPPLLHQHRFIKASWWATLPDEADELRQWKQALQQKGEIKAIVIDLGGHPSRSLGSRCSGVRSRSAVTPK